MDWSILAQDEDASVITCEKGTFVVHSSGRVYKDNIDGPVIHTISPTDEVNPFDDPNGNSVVWGKVFQDIEARLNTVYLIVEDGIEYNDNWYYIDHSQNQMREAYRSKEKADAVCREKRLSMMHEWQPGQFADGGDLYNITDHNETHIQDELKRFGITWDKDPSSIDLSSIRDDEKRIEAWDLFENAPRFASIQTIELEDLE